MFNDFVEILMVNLEWKEKAKGKQGKNTQNLAHRRQSNNFF